VVGTSRPRRAAQVLHHRPDARIVLFRGNVDTRLGKLAAGEVDATLLAAAGLERLGRPDVGHAVPLDTMLPAPSQGAVGIEVRAEDKAALAFVGKVDHLPTHQAVRAERGFLAALGADCHSPVAALARIDGDVLTLTAQLLAQDGSAEVRGEASGAIDDIDLPRTLAERLLDDAPEVVARLFAR